VKDRTDLGEEALDEANGLRGSRDPVDAGREGGNVLGGVGGAVHHEAAGLIGLLDVIEKRLDRLPEGALVGGVP
jgi:hypothetical protein